MSEAPRRPDEEERLAALDRSGLLTGAAVPEFDDLVKLAAHICRTPIALISLVAADSEHFIARVGVSLERLPRAVSLCAHAILDDATLMVPDAQSDPRFASHPLVTGPPFLRFYAGVPLRIDGGAPLGTLCVIDRDPRVLASDQREALEALARQVVSQVRLRERTAALERSSAELTALEEMGEYLQSCRSLEESSRVISTYGARLFSRLPGFVAMTNPVGRLVESFAAWGGAAPAPFALDECWALRRGRRYEVAPGRPSIVCAHVGDHGSGAHVCVPMMAHGETLGVVHLSRSSPRAITAGELQLATATAERLSLALGNIRLRATLRERDSLLPSAPAPSVAERPPSVRAPILPAVSAALSAAARRVPPTN